MDLGEEPWADRYWEDPRIHSFGNTGPGGNFHALVAPIFTKGLDMFAYNSTDFRTLSTQTLAIERAAAGLATERAVDIGCGIGASTRALREVWPDAEVSGCDTSEAMLRVCRGLTERYAATNDKKPIEIFQGHAEYTGLPSHEYDVVTVMFLLHEAPQVARKSILAEAKRLLRPGGSLMICDIAREYEPSATMKSGEPYIDGYLENVEDDIRSAGFSTVQVTQPIPGRAETWTCSVPTAAEEARMKRISKPVVQAMGVSFQLSFLLAAADLFDVINFGATPAVDSIQSVAEVISAVPIDFMLP